MKIFFAMAPNFDEVTPLRYTDTPGIGTPKAFSSA